MSNIDPTKEVDPHLYPPHYEPTAYAPIPPPPPYAWTPNPYDPYGGGRRRNRYWVYLSMALISLVVSIGLLLASLSGLLQLPTINHPAISASAYSSMPTQKPTLAPTATPTTVKTDYTADDILLDLNNAGIHPKFVRHNQTIWSWSDDNYQTTYPSTSSITFTDDSGCTGYCSPANLGIWVFSTLQIAQQTYVEVQQDALTVTPTGPTVYTSYGYVHGRCLLLGGDQTSIYGQVLTTYCV